LDLNTVGLNVNFIRPGLELELEIHSADEDGNDCNTGGGGGRIGIIGIWVHMLACLPAGPVP